ncbi:Dual specificity protein phosphatase 1B [Penicillium brevicompactum]|uniref:dual specificity phosphatase Yvh1 n=1 Tax=Penicillium brevicompactum TaxID=5074 RepID=UPI0025408B53|nr:dual specificity phosphatase Yvh1 [Penicillium brevicompactum]KAJ5332790.1 dual specificity phosphatase Yvh1 [Penicillium brevicompactum]
MGENATGQITQEERERRWQMAWTARMRQIVPGLYLGNVEASHKREMLQENHINAIISLTDARWVWWKSTTREAGVPEHRHKWTQCVDSSTQDLLVHMKDICDMIDEMASPALPSLRPLPVKCDDGIIDERHGAALEAILIHCDLGISRSPTVIIAYLMRKLNMSQADVLPFVQSKQKVKPSKNLTRQLQVWEDEDRTVPKPAYKAFLEDRDVLLRERGLTGNEPLAPLNL